MNATPTEVRDIFLAALEAEDVHQFLDEACGQDVQLRTRVEELLASHHEAGNFLTPPQVSGQPSETRDTAESVGTTIGRYKLLELIGEGGFGDVYMAEQQEPVRRKVALKIIKLGMDTRQVIARFEAERQALALMDHANIAKVLDAGATDTGRPYFVMDLVRGVPITEYCDANKLTTQERLKLFIDVCHAVQHAHQKGIIHRDLKPNNILVTQDNWKPVPKIIDFGVAKATQQRLTEKTLFTAHRQLVGTPEYMSPEQATFGESDVDTRSDIYSLGVLLYELVVGTTPFDANDLRSRGYDEICRVIREVDPATPSRKLSALRESVDEICRHRQAQPAALRKLLRGDLDWIAMKCLEKDRTRRYETANALALDIERHLSDEPVRARPPSTVYRVKKFIRKYRTHVVAAGIVLATVIVGLAVALAREKRLRSEADHARREAEEEGLRAAANMRLARTRLVDPQIHFANYRIHLSEDEQTVLALNPIPIWEWDDPPTDRRGQAGAVYVWLYNHRPLVIGTVLDEAWGGPVYGGIVATKHELHSLAFRPLSATYQGERVWTPSQAGIQFQPLASAPLPSPSREIRLSQMRDLAKEFQAQIIEMNGTRELRRKNKPIYRYKYTSTDWSDGGIFAFLHGGDPELVLLIEARGGGATERWHWAIARLSEYALLLTRGGKTVWQSPAPLRVGHEDIFEFPEYQQQTYICYVPAANPHFRLVERHRNLALAYADIASEHQKANRHVAAAEAAFAGLSAWGRLQRDANDERIGHLHRVILEAFDSLRSDGRLDEAAAMASNGIEHHRQLTPDGGHHSFACWLAYLHAELGQFSKAARAYSNASASDISNAWYWETAAALAWLGAGDKTAYRHACADLMRQANAATDSDVAARVAEVTLYAPHPSDIADQVTHRIEARLGIRGAEIGKPMLIDDFGDGKDDDWTHVDWSVDYPWGPGRYDVHSGAYQISGSGIALSGVRSAVASCWNDSHESCFSHGFLRAKVRANTTSSTALLCMRSTGLDAYVFGGNVVSGRFYIQRTAESRRTTSSLIRLDDPRMRFNAGEDWMFEAGAVGEQLSLKVWPVGQPEPNEPQLKVTDSGHLSGQIGVVACVPGMFDVSGLVSATFDDIYFTPQRPPPPTGSAAPEPNYHCFYAAAQFRAGQYQPAIARFRKVSLEFDHHDDEYTDFYRPWTQLFLSMAHSRQGNYDAAREAFRRAVTWMDQMESAEGSTPVARLERLRWFERLRLNVLRREAEQLLSQADSERNSDSL